MHPDIRAAFAGLIAALPAPGRVLEVGQHEGEAALIDLPALAGARERVAFGLEAGGMPPGVTVVRGNANDLAVLGAEGFDLVLCNSMLEHDPRFWLSLAGMRRVTRPGGHMILGVPGYGAMRGRARGWWGRLASSIRGDRADAQAASTSTLGLHGYPSDYYRFSRAAVEEVFLEGCEERRVFEVMDPPRFIGVGRKA
ncbi:methyltransferase domain-containing protein [Aquibium sp. ELW1220]|uniref:class I SAM-dependent methyltransferase n=1 Tax=Aquibium sp. ELW1220 TaxID=2976766 RepID=UPI0025B0C1C4|nr:methyltransferase domain-containing protein [Aquibium sp. ELW1220]MDN2583423.1 class I SAM-dependent methyltransferase [Aquibium sp. ELW1220]